MRAGENSPLLQSQSERVQQLMTAPAERTYFQVRVSTSPDRARRADRRRGGGDNAATWPPLAPSPESERPKLTGCSLSTGVVRTLEEE